MAIDRRQLLIGSLAVLAIPRGVLGNEARAAAEIGPVFLSAARFPGNAYGVVVFAEDGRVLREIPIKERGHDIAVDPVFRRAVVFARRPGFYALAFDIDGRREPVAFAPAPERHFYGHGVFSRDGRVLYATEHDAETGDGVIGAYDAMGGWRRIGEFPSYGVGPHEAIVLSDGKTMAVANGGFGNDPATGRESIGIGVMEPNISFIDLASGALKARHGLSDDINQLSLRHLVETPRGDIWFGAQWQGDLEESPPLIGSLGLDRPVRLLDPDQSSGLALRGYVGAVAMSADGRFLAATAPRADRVVYVDTETGKLAREIVIDDSSGITPAGPADFAMSTGKGLVRIGHGGGAGDDVLKFDRTEFDNHLRRV